MSNGYAERRESNLKERFKQFFHSREVPYGIALVRMFVPMALLTDMVARFPYAREIYSTDGAPTPLWITYGYAKFLPEIPGTPAVALVALLILALAASSVGWCTRVSLALSTVLYFYFSLVDSISTMTKYSVIATHVLLLLSLSRCGDVWSVDSWLARRKRARGGQADAVAGLPPRSPVWPQRLIQLMIGLVYFGAAMTKIHTPSYFSGDQIHSWIITTLHYDHIVGHWMTLWPGTLIVCGYVAIAWEVVFVFLAWKGWGRIVCLTLGVLFHLMTTLMLGLIIFPAICIAIYFSFANERDVERATVFIYRLRKRYWPARPARTSTSQVPPVPQPLPVWRRVPSAAAYVATAVLVVGGGLALEYELDLYGLRRAEGRYTLEKIDRSFVENTLLNANVPVRDVDKFGVLKLGTVTMGNSLAYERTRFKPGETITAMCTVTPLHEDMWVDCALVDGLDQVLDRRGQVLARESLRANFSVPLPENLEPGRYAVVLKKGNRELIRRSFTLLPGAKRRSTTASAN